MTKPKKNSKRPYIAHFEGNTVFAGVHWDAQALESVHTVAAALLNLTRLFVQQDVKIGTMLHVGPKEISEETK